MATVLGTGSDRLVVVFFGQRIEFSKSGNSEVSCTAGSATETASQILSVFSGALAWFESPSPRTPIDLGPLFGQSFRFLEQWGQPACYATHGDKLGMKESPASIQSTMNLVKNWLIAAGVK